MWGTIALKIAGMFYRGGGRAVIKKHVDDPNHTWDDAVILTLDRVFNYTE